MAVPVGDIIPDPAAPILMPMPAPLRDVWEYVRSRKAGVDAPVPVPVGENGGSGTSPGERGEWTALPIPPPPDMSDGWVDDLDRGWPCEASFRRNSTKRLENDCSESALTFYVLFQSRSIYPHLSGGH